METTFLESVLKASQNRFLCVDVGCRNGVWDVVEVNPPFALEQYTIDVNVYIDFCQDAWQRMC